MDVDSKLMFRRPPGREAKPPRKLPGYVYETRIGEGPWTRAPEVRPMHQADAAHAAGKMIRVLVAGGYEASARLVPEGEFEAWW